MISQFVLHNWFFPRPIVSDIFLDNRPFPSCPNPLFQGEAKCEAIYKKKISYSSANKDRFHKKGRAQGIVWKWKFWNLEMAYYNAAFIACRFPLAPLGSLSIDDGGGDDEKCIRAFFLQTFRAYSISFSSLKVGKSFGSWIIKDCIEVQEKKKKVVVSRSHPPRNVIGLI